MLGVIDCTKLMLYYSQDLRTQLTQEREAVRRISLQKDIEVKELQGKIDKAVCDPLCCLFWSANHGIMQTQELGKTREYLIAAETSKKHLEERVEQLTRQLQGNEEKLAVYERRAGSITGVNPRTDEDMSREQQLEAEVAELRLVFSPLSRYSIALQVLLGLHSRSPRSTSPLLAATSSSSRRSARRTRLPLLR